MRRWRWVINPFGRWLGPALLIGAAIASIVHATVRDRYAALDTLYYLSPSVLISLAAGVAAVMFAMRRRRGWAAVAAVLAAVWLVIWIRGDWRIESGTPIARGPVLRVALFNAAGTKRCGQPGVAELLTPYDPDIIVLVEAGFDFKRVLDRWRELFPQYELLPPMETLLVLVRGQAVVRSSGALGGEDRGRHMLVDATTSTASLRILAADIFHNPLVTRRGQFFELTRLIEGQPGDQPLLVLGDFNTPRGSVFFDLLERRGLTEAFDVAGRGYRATWPWPLPVLSLDQAWCNQRVQPLRVAHVWTACSDHRAVVLDLAINP